jgi:hypothetical protein
MSNRTKINNKIIDSLKEINGLSSSYSSDYNFKTDLHLNVYSGLKFIDEINDFPCIYSVSPTETREYNTTGTTQGKVNTILRCYLYSDDLDNQAQNLIDDIEHVVYSLRFDTGLQVKDVKITNILRDNGLLKPYGMVEIFLSTSFEIFDF